MHFTIKDIENLSGIKAHTIRIWEQRYSFFKPVRTEKNIRLYDDHQLKTILNIALLNKYGYKISHINKMSQDVINDKIISLSSSAAQTEIIINDLIDNMVRVDMTALEATLDIYIKTHGIENTLVQIIYPFFERIGVLWLTNHINPSQEHLVSNIVRRKIIAATENLQPSAYKNVTACLFLPEGEYHELGLLFINYLLKTSGIVTLYVGASIPFIDVKCLVELKKPEYVFTHLTSTTQNFNFDKFLNNLSNHFPQSTVIVSGKITNTYSKTPPSNIHFKKSLAELKAFTETL